MFIKRILFSQNTVLVPDYGNYKNVLHLSSGFPPYSYLCSVYGDGLTADLKTYPHYWVYAHKYDSNGKQISYKNHDINASLSYTVQRSGYIYATTSIVSDMDTWSSSMVHNGKISSFAVVLARGYTNIDILECSTTIGDKSGWHEYKSAIVPVRKGDVIHFGTMFEGDEYPGWANIYFYPGVDVDAKTGE